MRPDVFHRWYAKTIELEGCIDHMYLDVLGLVTTGVGNLIDTVGAALALPWKLAGPDGRALENVPAAAHEVSIAWNKVKGAQSMKLLGGANPRWAQLTDVRLTPAGIEALVRTRLEQNEYILRHRFPDHDTWPDNVTIAVHSLAWACGAGFHFPKLEDALYARDWVTCAKECHIEDSHNPGVRPRNRWMMQLFEHAIEFGPEAPTQPERASLPGPRDSMPDLGVDEIVSGDGVTVLDGADLKKAR
jgi:GH24 family phage-related lysozyme (muramidase)